MVRLSRILCSKTDYETLTGFSQYIVDLIFAKFPVMRIRDPVNRQNSSSVSAENVFYGEWTLCYIIDEGGVS